MGIDWSKPWSEMTPQDRQALTETLKGLMEHVNKLDLVSELELMLAVETIRRGPGFFETTMPAEMLTVCDKRIGEYLIQLGVPWRKCCFSRRALFHVDHLLDVAIELGDQELFPLSRDSNDRWSRRVIDPTINIADNTISHDDPFKARQEVAWLAEHKCHGWFGYNGGSRWRQHSLERSPVATEAKHDRA